MRTKFFFAFVDEVEVGNDESCGHGEVVVGEICEGNAEDHDDEEIGFLFEDGSRHHSGG